jgi:nucleoid-associated protein YgaU
MPDQRAVTLGKVVRAATSTSPAYPAPTASPALSPTSGAAAGGTAVTVTGTDLSGVVAVLFDDVPGTGLTVTSDTSVVVTTPAHGAGAVTVTVVTPGGVVKKTTAFTYS